MNLRVLASAHAYVRVVCLFRERMVMAKLRPTYAFVKRLEFLSSGRIHLRDSVKVVTLFYNTHGSNSSGVR